MSQHKMSHRLQSQTKELKFNRKILKHKMIIVTWSKQYKWRKKKKSQEVKDLMGVGKIK